MTALVGTTKTRLNLREGPGTDYLVLAILPKGARLEIVEDMGSWLNVVVEGVLGYVHEDYVIVHPPPRPVRLKTVQEPPVFEGSVSGITNTLVNLRAGPGRDYPVVAVLPPGSPLRVMEDLGDWLNVMHGSRLAYVSDGLVDFEAAAGFESERGGAPAEHQQPQEMRPAAAIETVPEAPGWLAALVANVRQRYGAVIESLSVQLGIESSVAGAVVAVECGRTGLNPDGSLALRFEVHLFWHYWGLSNQAAFSQYFRFDPYVNWQGHEFRPAPDAAWQPVHGAGQAVEQAAFAVASSLHSTAARLSTAMGAPQIMGFNFRLLGFDTVHAMFDAFAASEENQLRGFFNLVHGGIDPADGIAALRERDFRAFARYYHGEEQVEKYAPLIRQAYGLYAAGQGEEAETAQRKPMV